MLPAVFGIVGEALSADDRSFFRDANPAGYILFRRNCSGREQLRRLTDSLRALHGRALPILIDQEGGRVARLQPPEWPEFPSPALFDALYQISPVAAIEAARANATATALILREAGITVNCAPLLDLRHQQGHAVIGDRALGSTPMQVAALGRGVVEGLREGGVVAVVKHMPGQGRSTADSHVECPVVNADAAALNADIEPFSTLSGAPMGMAAHVLFTAWDPKCPASVSKVVIDDVIRTRIGFTGCLLSDDIGMGALSGDLGARARAVVGAGCDIALHCSGDRSEMEEVAGALDAMVEKSGERLDRAMATILDGGVITYAEATARRDSLLAYC